MNMVCFALMLIIYVFFFAGMIRVVCWSLFFGLPDSAHRIGPWPLGLHVLAFLLSDSALQAQNLGNNPQAFRYTQISKQQCLDKHSYLSFTSTSQLDMNGYTKTIRNKV